MTTQDRFGRPLGSLRISVTDRCNLRCSYCMPEESYVWLPKPSLLSFEEIGQVVDAFIRLGLRKVRLTGGEPLLRRELPSLIALLARKPLDDIALTTNGLLLTDSARELRAAGLSRLTVSLDTLQNDRFLALTRRAELDRVFAGIDAARSAGFEGLKIDTVVLRGTNEDELVDLLRFGQRIGAEVRFIEYMDVGGATQWRADDVVSQDEILALIGEQMGPVRPVSEERGSAPAARFELEDGTRFGIIASTTKPFCSACDRARLTADGNLLTCLYARDGVDLRPVLRGGGPRDDLENAIAGVWRARADRGAEERASLSERGPLVPVERLRRAPHMEMHTRGG